MKYCKNDINLYLILKAIRLLWFVRSFFTVLPSHRITYLYLIIKVLRFLPPKFSSVSFVRQDFVRTSLPGLLRRSSLAPQIYNSRIRFAQEAGFLFLLGPEMNLIYILLLLTAPQTTPTA